MQERFGGKQVDVRDVGTAGRRERLMKRKVQQGWGFQSYMGEPRATT